MPKVGSKHFPYTKQGKKDAAQHAAAAGKKVQYKPPQRKK